MKKNKVIVLFVGALVCFFIAICLIYAEKSKKEQAAQKTKIDARFEQLKTEAREGYLIVIESDGFLSGMTCEIVGVDQDNEKVILKGPRGVPFDEWMAELAKREFRLIPLVSTFAEKSAE